MKSNELPELWIQTHDGQMKWLYAVGIMSEAGVRIVLVVSLLDASREWKVLAWSEGSASEQELGDWDRFLGIRKVA